MSNWGTTGTAVTPSAPVTMNDVNAAIAALIASPEVDYKVGNKTFKNSQKMDQLLKVRKMLMETPTDATVVQMAFDALDIDVFGKDSTQHVL